MISDVISDALQSIDDCKSESPDAYVDVADHIELVKSVMASLMGRLDDPFGDEQPRLGDLISEDQKHLWRVTCEANMARWAERLRLLGPVSAEQISSKLHDAIARQEAMLSQNCPDFGVRVGPQSADEGQRQVGDRSATSTDSLADAYHEMAKARGLDDSSRLKVLIWAAARIENVEVDW